MRRGLLIIGLVATALVAEVAAARPPHVTRNADELRRPKDDETSAGTSTRRGSWMR
jgi:hypothetical protein